MPFVDHGIHAIDAVRASVPTDRWVSSEEVRRACGFSGFAVRFRLRQLFFRGELDRRAVFVEHGGRTFEYRRLEQGAVQSYGCETWQMNELAQALGGYTLPPPGLQHPEPSVRHTLFH
jgi:hypothetical protein